MYIVWGGIDRGADGEGCVSGVSRVGRCVDVEVATLICVDIEDYDVVLWAPAKKKV